MAITLEKFIKKYNGKQVEYHSFGTGSKFQCIDLVNQYIEEVLELTPIIGTNAKDVLKKADSNYFPLANTPLFIPKAGDIVVWNGNMGGGAGHIAIVRSADINKLYTFDQNFSKPLYCTLETHSYSNVIGFMRKKGADTTPPLDKDIITDANNWRKLRQTIPGIESIDDAVKMLQATGDIKTDSNNWKAVRKLYSIESVEQLTQYVDKLRLAGEDTDCQKLLDEQEKNHVKQLEELRSQFATQKELLKKQIINKSEIPLSELLILAWEKIKL